MVYQLDKISTGLDYTFNKNARRFADKNTGKFLSQNKVKELLNQSIADKSDRLQALGKDLASGKIDLTKFLTDGAETIKQLHILNAVTANNGRADTMSRSQLETLQDRVNSQLKPYFRELIKELSNGEVSEAQLLNRLKMYADSAVQTQGHIEFENKKEQGYTEGFRTLGATDKHCKECIAYASLGWVKLTDLVKVGESCSCAANCKCSIMYR